MTIAQWFDENGIENLPILNICVCRGMKKEDYESHLFLQIESRMLVTSVMR